MDRVRRDHIILLALDDPDALDAVCRATTWLDRLGQESPDLVAVLFCYDYVHLSEPEQSEYSIRRLCQEYPNYRLFRLMDQMIYRGISGPEWAAILYSSRDEVVSRLAHEPQMARAF